MKVEFWTELAAKKLDTYRLNDDAQVDMFWFKDSLDNWTTATSI